MLFHDLIDALCKSKVSTTLRRTHLNHFTVTLKTDAITYCDLIYVTGSGNIEFYMAVMK